MSYTHTLEDQVRNLKFDLQEANKINEELEDQVYNLKNENDSLQNQLYSQNRDDDRQTYYSSIRFA